MYSTHTPLKIPKYLSMRLFYPWCRHFIIIKLPSSFLLFVSLLLTNIPTFCLIYGLFLSSFSLSSPFHDQLKNFHPPLHLFISHLMFLSCSPIPPDIYFSCFQQKSFTLSPLPSSFLHWLAFHSLFTSCIVSPISAIKASLFSWHHSSSTFFNF